MALSKRAYTDGQTVITAANLNAIQDEIITNASNIATIQSTQVLVVTISSAGDASATTFTATVRNSAITASHVLLASTLGTPSAQTGDWTVTTSAGSVTVTGSCSGTTTLQLILGKSGATIS